MTVEYHPAIEAELREIRQYYEDRSPGLGTQFIDEFERQVLLLAANPERWMVVKADVRRCLDAVRCPERRCQR
jgi:toxin ParE1/3/4